jgi:uncharacterized protein involved in response to NO
MTTNPQWRIAQLFAYPFRIFFFSLPLWALAIVPLWLVMLLAPAQWPLPMVLPALLWHQHEMLFALLNAAIAGFLLTAVGNWTQTVPLSGRPLFALWSLWLLGRVALLLGELLPGWLAVLPDLLFLPCVMLDAGRRIFRAQQWRQLPVLGVLLLLWLMQLSFHIGESTQPLRAALVLAMALMSVIGGRITPSFSNNWLRAQGQAQNPPSAPWLDHAVLIVLVALVPAVFWSIDVAIAPLAVAGAALSLLRLWQWRGWRIAKEPLLWILHVSLLWIPVALLLLAGSHLFGWPPVAWLHAGGIGAMASLIYGVMTRVALGHTGRALQLPAGVVVGYLALQLGAIVRVATVFTVIDWHLGVLTSAALWMVAFAIFVWRYAGILLTPRPDGRSG